MFCADKYYVSNRYIWKQNKPRWNKAVKLTILYSSGGCSLVIGLVDGCDAGSSPLIKRILKLILQGSCNTRAPIVMSRKMNLTKHAARSIIYSFGGFKNDVTAPETRQMTKISQWPPIYHFGGGPNTSDLLTILQARNTGAPCSLFWLNTNRLIWHQPVW